jgi:hypothetical protein
MAKTNLPSAKPDDWHFDAIGQSNVSVVSRHFRFIKRIRRIDEGFEFE